MSQIDFPWFYCAACDKGEQGRTVCRWCSKPMSQLSGKNLPSSAHTAALPGACGSSVGQTIEQRRTLKAFLGRCY